MGCSKTKRLATTKLKGLYMKESIKVLEECKELQLKKSQDYQNSYSTIKQADYYRRGLQTILDTMHSKVLRMCSVLDAIEKDKKYKQNFESLEDSAKDLINYASFFVAYSRGKMEGQEIKEEEDPLSF